MRQAKRFNSKQRSDQKYRKDKNDLRKQDKSGKLISLIEFSPKSSIDTNCH